MTRRTGRPARILAIDPISKGFGFVVLEAEPVQLVDWGTTMCRRTDDALGASVRALLARYQPTILVLEEPIRARSMARRRALTAAVGVIAESVQGICEIKRVARESVIAARASLGASNKRQAVGVLVERFPELRSKVPPDRFIWQSEDARWAVFDALVLAGANVQSWNGKRADASQPCAKMNACERNPGEGLRCVS